MGKGKTLLKNTAIVSIGKIATQLITFFLLPIYTAVLTKEEYGVVDLLNTLVNLFLPIVTLQIEQGIFRYLIDCRENKEKQTKIITTIMRFIVMQSLTYVVILLIASQFINNEYKYFLAGNLLVSIFSSILLQVCRGLGDNKRYAIGSFLSGFAVVVLNVILIVGFHMAAYGMLLATLIGNLICVLYIFFSKKIYEYIKIDQNDDELLKEIIKYSIPLVPNMVSWWVVNASDRTLIATFLGIAQNGIYSAATKFTNVFSSLYIVFNLTWTESAAINIDAPDREDFFSKILDVTVRFFGSIALGIIAYMPFVFRILINESYSEAYYQIPILMIGSMFNILVSFIGAIYVAKKKTKEIAKVSIFAAIINILTNLAMIKFIGLYSASISTLLAYFIMFVLRLKDVKKYVKLKFKKSIVISIIMLTIVSIIIYYLRNSVLDVCSALAVTIYAILINKSSAKFILDSVKDKLKKKRNIVK